MEPDGTRRKIEVDASGALLGPEGPAGRPSNSRSGPALVYTSARLRVLVLIVHGVGVGLSVENCTVDANIF